MLLKKKNGWKRPRGLDGVRKQPSISLLAIRSFQKEFPDITPQQVHRKFQSLEKRKKLEKIKMSSNSLFLKMKDRRRWSLKNGKKLDFSDHQLNKIYGFFNQLDVKKEGFIGSDQLFQPMISLGVIQTKEELQKIIFSVDDDGDIHFSQFLNLLKIKQAEGENALVSFFKDLLNGKVGDQPLIPSMPFRTLIDKIRRKKIKDGIFSNKLSNKLEGMKVIKGYMNKLSEGGVIQVADVEKKRVQSMIQKLSHTNKQVTLPQQPKKSFSKSQKRGVQI